MRYFCMHCAMEHGKITEVFTDMIPACDVCAEDDYVDIEQFAEYVQKVADNLQLVAALFPLYEKLERG